VTTKAQKQEVRTNRLVFKMFKFVYWIDNTVYMYII
jgi:hypothetical protein